ncbi:hypothetical protein BKA93DRAFT_820692 [Sparassis latifolia]|uniref:Uncharacterized protein n=1 Tax=Sparassis crispa TaxID=139825 RepID=A0A401GTT4_9APHY|nr:hypothetical protein SCP_0801460 [Sparassis crispa]GBE85627.1 hypothetical protein SCP_0801460 [Sparassis crispa]
MSVATPTVLPRSLLFPNLLPQPPQPHPTPLPPYGHRTGRLNSRRDLQREMDELSEEEEELRTLTHAIKKRGFNFIVPIGRTHTQHEEKNDADEDEDDDDDDDDDSASVGSETNLSQSNEASDEEAGEESEEDLDADMEDLDEAEDVSGEATEHGEDEEHGEEEEEEEREAEPSSDM